MDTKNQETYGFTGKVTSHKAGLYLRIPDKTVESSKLQDKTLLHLEIRNMYGETTSVSRKAMSSGGQIKVYLPKKVRTQLNLKHKDLVDVFLQKD